MRMARKDLENFAEQIKRYMNLDGIVHLRYDVYLRRYNIGYSAKGTTVVGDFVGISSLGWYTIGEMYEKLKGIMNFIYYLANKGGKLPFCQLPRS